MKEFNIAGITLNNRYVLAPIAGFTDYATRRISAEYGASLCYSEMESCESLYYGSMATIKDLKSTIKDKKEGRRLALQIFGGKADIVLKSIPIVEQYADYDFLDFNCGCPVNKVVKQRCGSYWLKRPDELIDLLSEMVKVSKKPVIVKVRIGFENVMDMVPLCKRIQEVGVKAISVHGRCRSEFFSSQVHYDVIADIKRNLSIPVIANGEINQNNFLDVLKLTDCDAIMIGQHALGYPKIFQDMINIEEGKDIIQTTIDGQISDLKKHLDYIYSDKDERSASSIMRSFSVKYIKNFPNSKDLRSKLVQCLNKNDYLEILNSVQNEQKIS